MILLRPVWRKNCTRKKNLQTRVLDGVQETGTVIVCPITNGEGGGGGEVNECKSRLKPLARMRKNFSRWVTDCVCMDTIILCCLSSPSCCLALKINLCTVALENEDNEWIAAGLESLVLFCFYFCNFSALGLNFTQHSFNCQLHYSLMNYYLLSSSHAMRMGLQWRFQQHSTSRSFVNDLKSYPS